MQTFNIKRSDLHRKLMSEVDCNMQPASDRLHLCGEGPTKLLEEYISEFYGIRYCIAFSSATNALSALSLALGLSGKEIITSPINWGSSIAPFLYCNSKLRFSSIEPNTLNIDANALPSLKGHKSGAILSVDYNGFPADTRSIKRYSQKNNLFYISDCSQSFGAYRDGKPAGYWADAIVVSFSPGKTLYTGEGGAMLTNSEELYNRLIFLTQHPSRQKIVLGLSNYNEYTPINGRINPLGAAMGAMNFHPALVELASKQDLCYKILCSLGHNGLIEGTEHISSKTSSTFFRLAYELKNGVEINDVNRYLEEQNYPYSATHTDIRLIPFDSMFMEQFRGKYRCTKELLKQRGLLRNKKYITLENFPKKS
jgi:perosamine synthetase